MYKTTSNGAEYYEKYEIAFSTAGTIYYSYYYEIVLSVLVLTLCVLVYLIFVNIASRRILKRNTSNIVWKGYSRCLCYLCLLHVTSWILIGALLLKHVNAFWSSWSCKLANRVLVIATHFSEALIWQIYKSRHGAMSSVLRQHSLVVTATQFLTTVLVLFPLGTLALTLSKLKTKWDSHECMLYIPVWCGRAKMYINIGICLVFSALFIAQMWKAFRTIKYFDADRRLLTTENSLRSTRNTALRNVAVTSLTLFWLVIYYGPLNYGYPTHESKAEQYSLYTCRLVLGLTHLTTNMILYFVFRTWRFFLCYPFCNLDSSSIFLKLGTISPKSTTTFE